MGEKEIIFIGLREIQKKKDGDIKTYRIFTYAMELNGEGKSIDEFIGETKYDYLKSLNMKYGEKYLANFTMDFNRKVAIKEIVA